MKAVAFSEAGTRILVLSVIAAVIWAVAGCGFSYNSTAGKSPAESAVPIITCSASPTSVISGNSVQISTKASSPLGLPLSYSYGATAGSIASEGSFGHAGHSGRGRKHHCHLQSGRHDGQCSFLRNHGGRSVL